MTDYNSTPSGDVATPETTNLRWQSHAGRLIQQHDRMVDVLTNFG